ncbi:MAG: bifunctional hydroxymethylpyrimidine kinase/phosphomethylpyrimidine kinase [Desulfurococcales archaeon]|nr:bifunctional hydroxymethylpyrimidine kinase/phosphomethylpyrimidine kinase [Desulfurococcales archaeon]
MAGRRIPVALTIAGSDSGGGAGIEADLKVFAVLGVHGTAAITSVTAQNTREVTGVYDLPPEAVVRQIEAVHSDLGVDAAKTGMLSNSVIVEAVARTVERLGFPLVVDPVMIAKSGAPLLREDAVKVLREKLIPLAKVVTPNRMEAEKLTGMEIRSLEDARRAAKYIVRELGAEAAVVKGGHLGGPESADVLYYRGEYRVYKAPRIEGGCTHGTGCGFSAAIAAELAKGRDVPEAVGVAKRLITMAIEYGLHVGGGHCPINPVAWLMIPAERWRAVESVEDAVALILREAEILEPYAPEVGMNVVQAIAYPYARTPEDVVGVEGRIVRVRGGLRAVGPARPGASSHMARLVLAAMSVDPRVRGAVNIAYHPELVEAAEGLGLRVVRVGREEEPEEVRRAEGRSMQWLLEEAARRAGGAVPDVIYDEGGLGKEAMIRVLAATALEAAEKLVAIARRASRR